jgi:hypothetical protein
MKAQATPTDRRQRDGIERSVGTIVPSLLAGYRVLFPYPYFASSETIQPLQPADAQEFHAVDRDVLSLHFAALRSPVSQAPGCAHRKDQLALRLGR